MTPASVSRSAVVASTRPRYLALCARHTEPLVAAELIALPEVTDVEVRSGAVAFSGPRAALYRANLHSRCASRILRVLGDYSCGGPADLYEAVRTLPWEEFVSAEGTLAVSAMGEAPGLGNSMFTALKTKDAVVDRFRDRLGRRPDVDPHQPDVLILSLQVTKFNSSLLRSVRNFHPMSAQMLIVARSSYNEA